MRSVYSLGMLDHGKNSSLYEQLEPQLRADFIAEAAAAHRPASQVLGDLMHEFVQRQREAREYSEFKRRKVEIGLAQARAGQGIPNEVVEAEFAALKAQVHGCR